MQLITFFMDVQMKEIRFEEEDAKKKAPEMPDPLAEKFIKTRQILLSGEINKDLAEKIVRQLLVLEADDSEKPIYMYIDSPGGDVDAGFAIFDMIRFIKSPVILIGMGLIASAAALILLAVDKENRVALPNSRYLIHQPSSGMRGVATDIEIHAKEMEKTNKLTPLQHQFIAQDICKIEIEPLQHIDKMTMINFFLFFLFCSSEYIIH